LGRFTNKLHRLTGDENNLPEKIAVECSPVASESGLSGHAMVPSGVWPNARLSNGQAKRFSELSKASETACALIRIQIFPRISSGRSLPRRTATSQN
jgi:hypothetical protein